jgi:hypothetical protein
VTRKILSLLNSNPTGHLVRFRLLLQLDSKTYGRESLAACEGPPYNNGCTVGTLDKDSIKIGLPNTAAGIV